MTCGEYYRMVIELRKQQMTYREIAEKLAWTGASRHMVEHACRRYRKNGPKIFESKRPLHNGVGQTLTEDNMQDNSAKFEYAEQQTAREIRELRDKIHIGDTLLYSPASNEWYAPENRSMEVKFIGKTYIQGEREARIGIKIRETVSLYDLWKQRKTIVILHKDIDSNPEGGRGEDS